MRNETFAFVTIAVVIVSALAGYYMGSVTTHETVTSTTTAYPVGLCFTPIGPSNATGMTDVYQMTPGSVGLV